MSGHKIRKIAEISMSKAPVKTPTESWPRSQLRPDCGQQKMNLNLQRINVLSNIGQKMNLTLQRIINNNVLSNIGQKINLNAQRITRGIHTVSCKWNNAIFTQCKKKNSLCYLIPKPYLVGFPLFYKFNNSEHVKKKIQSNDILYCANWPNSRRS